MNIFSSESHRALSEAFKHSKPYVHIYANVYVITQVSVSEIMHISD